MLGEADGLLEVAEGFALAVGTGNRGRLPGLLMALAEGQRAVGEDAKALGMVESGLALAAASGQHFQDAALHRLKGELLLAADPVKAAVAEGLFRHALETP